MSDKDFITEISGLSITDWDKIREQRAEDISHFNALPWINENVLKTGDILLRKDYEGNNCKDSPVVCGQYLLDKLESDCKADKGSIFSSHALIYIGDGKIAESSNRKNGIRIGQLSEYDGGRLLVYHCKNGGARAKAVELAKKWATQEHISYSYWHCLIYPCIWNWGENAQKRAGQAAKGVPPSKEMMCSEFVTYCYQATGETSIKLDARHTAPMRLEHYLNEAENFDFVGRIGENAA